MRVTSLSNQIWENFEIPGQYFEKMQIKKKTLMK